MPPLLRSRARRAAALALLAAVPSGATEPLYQWSDDSGAVRYTAHRERIPPAYRERARAVEPGHSAAENAALLPGARSSSAGEPSPEPSGGGPDEAPAPPPASSLPSVETPAETEGEPSDPSEAGASLDARIAELEAAIERDQSALEELVSDPEAASQLRESDALAAIARRLPRLQEELRTLRARREARAGPDGS